MSETALKNQKQMSETAWKNQKQINGRLCQVDWRLIAALREVVAALKAPGKHTVDFVSLNGLIDEADRISASVAIPDPPGCDPVERNAPPPIS